MPRPAHRAVLGLGPRLRRALVRGVALTGGTALVAVGGAGMALNRPEPARDFEVDVATTSPLGKLMDRYECSALGFDDGSTPRASIVRGPDGTLRVVSFDAGWRAYTDGGPDRLVAVCLRGPRSAR